MAPEQIRGEPATQASDIYGLAAVLYESLAGTVPYPKDSDVAVIYAHLSDPPPKLTDVRPDMPKAFDDVLARAMAKDATARYPTAVAMVERPTRRSARRHARRSRFPHRSTSPRTWHPPPRGSGRRPRPHATARSTPAADTSGRRGGRRTPDRARHVRRGCGDPAGAPPTVSAPGTRRRTRRLLHDVMGPPTARRRRPRRPRGPRPA